MRSLLSLVASCGFLMSTATTVFAQGTPAPPGPETAAPAPPAEPATAAEPEKAAAPAETQPPPPQAPPVMAPPPSPPPPPPAPAPGGMASFLAKFSATLYGYIALYTIVDSTQSFNEAASNGNILATGYGHEHGRVMFSARHSRFGIRLRGPETPDIKTSALFEMDFLGNQPAVSEASLFTNATVRARHLWGKIETPFVDVLFGQTWSLFGGGGYFFPNSAQIQGLPGQIFSRVAQARLSHMFKTPLLNIEPAFAAVRPPQRDGNMPDIQAGVRVLLPKWTGVHTVGVNTSVDAGGFGTYTVVRRYAVARPMAPATENVTATGWGISAEAFLPIIPATAAHRANALSFTGEFVYGRGTADLYSGIIGTPAAGTDVDTGLVALDAAGTLHTIQWTSLIAGLQYYAPPDGRVWAAVNFGLMDSSNAAANGAASAATYKQSHFVDLCGFFNINAAARVALEYAWFNQTRFDDTDTTNHRLQINAYYIF